jgi:hypothetical protein
MMTAFLTEVTVVAYCYKTLQQIKVKFNFILLYFYNLFSKKILYYTNKIQLIIDQMSYKYYILKLNLFQMQGKCEVCDADNVY